MHLKLVTLALLLTLSIEYKWDTQIRSFRCKFAIDENPEICYSPLKMRLELLSTESPPHKEGRERIILCFDTRTPLFPPQRLRPLAMPQGAKPVSVCVRRHPLVAVGIHTEVRDRRVGGERGIDLDLGSYTCPLLYPSARTPRQS